jgi:hypothetical protein
MQNDGIQQSVSMKVRRPVAATLMPAEAPTSSLTLQPMQVNISDSAITRMLALKQGLYLIHATPAVTLSQVADKPFIRVSVPPCVGDEINNVVLGVVGSTQQTMPASGGATIVNVRSRRGTLVISGHGFSGVARPTLDIAIRSIRLPVRSLASRPSPPRPEARTIRSEIALIMGLRIERLGLRYFANGGWAGSRRRHLGISELTLRTAAPDAGLSFAIDEFTSASRVAALAADPSHASGIDKTPLIGFGVRIAPPQDQEFTVVYMGAFAKAGIIGPASDGTPCRSPTAGDALVAVDIWLRPRRSEAASRTAEAVPG